MASAALKVTDENGVVYRFSYAPTEQGGRGWVLESRPWVEGDPVERWRIALHPFDGGLYSDRFHENPRTYAKGNCDVSCPNVLLFPPLINSLSDANISTPTKAVPFDGKLFIVGGRYMFYFDPATNTITQDKDFGSGKAAVDAAVFNNELIVAMGESEKIHKRTTGGSWSQASDNTFAIALGVVGARLWRAESTNRISSCSTTPLTLVNWAPASPNQYYAGDTTYAVHSIVDYGGVPWIGKGDGVYIADSDSRFRNQVPQLAKAPHADNARGMFTALGALWIPSFSGMFRVTSGTSKKRGPEISSRPDYRFWVRGGVEIGDAMYWLVTDEAASAATFICKVTRSSINASIDDRFEYVYQEWARLDGTSKGYFLAATTAGTNPELLCGYGTTGLRWLKLGRGGGRDVDDSNYAFGTSMTLETGSIPLGPELSAFSTIVGVDTILDYSRSGESLSISIIPDRKPADATWTPLLDSQETGGVAPIALTNGYEKVTRYAPPGTKAKMVDVKFEGTLSSASGTARPTIREAHLRGFTHPEVTDVISVALIAGDNVTVDGMQSGLSHEGHMRLFRQWKQDGEELLCEFEDYDTNQSVRCLVGRVEMSNVETTPGNNGYSSDQKTHLKVQFTRIDRAGTYANE